LTVNEKVGNNKVDRREVVSLTVNTGRGGDGDDGDDDDDGSTPE
jgi:hypothetical protein